MYHGRRGKGGGGQNIDSENKQGTSLSVDNFMVEGKRGTTDSGTISTGKTVR